MPYRAPVEDYRFIFENVVDMAQVAGTERFADATEDMTSAILTELGKMAEEVLYPIQRNGDLNGAVLENGVVRTSPGYAEAFRAMADGGWLSVSATPEHGGMGLPLVMNTAYNEMVASTCMALGLCPLLTQGQIEALEHHASDALKEMYLPKLISGEWTGTMNLTEPGAGSDVGALKSKAERNDDGSYSVTGQKIFITWGDHDFGGNVCHLVLARLPDGGAGTKGISLFMVPKFLPNEDGSLGERNSLGVVSLEHKLGIHGSPTCVMQFDGAKGWLVGQEHKGMAAMFTMMNNARLSVGVQGVGIAEGALQHAMAYAQEREQMGKIIQHADVRRMLLTMKADTFAARSLVLDCSVALDMANATGEAAWGARAALLTPIAKAFSTDVGMAVAELGVQIHGGMGFIEETGAAQFSRDVRITAIYEGTNGIQAMDLVGRKMMDGGEAAFTLLDEIETHAEQARAVLPELAEPVWQATETLREAVEWMLAQKDMNDRFAGAVPFLTAFGRVLGGHYHLKAAMAEGGNGTRTKVARFYVNRLLPQFGGLLEHAMAGAADLYDITNDELVA
ncbi:acyl-CoA dehydrogenase [Thalassobius vesicularis]|uniref:3-methylmercaptopropionyl-CoA dehydrogenase n=1 Tax=Thalassobius vesicularis TaxID=1294297 RepID=A0A4S3MBG3_9RHOB|nr:acyl-CoA dehydrogenase [Thalassobius vesicularis]THD75965.1 acyl-CoA dehydrogenase [Thalassobius vesicularis]